MSKKKKTKPYFNQAEAEGTISRHIRTQVEFNGVPAGTRGHVVSVDRASGEGNDAGELVPAYHVAVQWHMTRPVSAAEIFFSTAAEPYLELRSGKPLVDWAGKDEYERYLYELSGEGGMEQAVCLLTGSVFTCYGETVPLCRGTTAPRKMTANIHVGKTTAKYAGQPPICAADGAVVLSSLRCS